MEQNDEYANGDACPICSTCNDWVAGVFCEHYLGFVWDHEFTVCSGAVKDFQIASAELLFLISEHGDDPALRRLLASEAELDTEFSKLLAQIEEEFPVHTLLLEACGARSGEPWSLNRKASDYGFNVYAANTVTIEEMSARCNVLIARANVFLDSH